MRFQRTMMSISVCSSMWPMWRLPVTLGGGRVMVKSSWPRSGGAFRRGRAFRGPSTRPSAVQSRPVRRLWEIVRHACPFSKPRSNLDITRQEERRANSAVLVRCHSGEFIHGAAALGYTVCGCGCLLAHDSAAAMRLPIEGCEWKSASMTLLGCRSARFWSASFCIEVMNGSIAGVFSHA